LFASCKKQEDKATTRTGSENTAQITYTTYGEGWGTLNQSLIAVKNPKRKKNRYASCRLHGPP
jgi:hypothetical protein